MRRRPATNTNAYDVADAQLQVEFAVAVPIVFSNISEIKTGRGLDVQEKVVQNYAPDNIIKESLKFKMTSAS